jgi:hypothetical protein
MNIMSSAKDLFTNTQEFENGSHIAKKKKAVENQFQKKNFKQIIEMIDDEDVEVAEKYARYIR